MLVHMIGNAHIDPVWLWPWQSGADEALATMASAADRCDEYPEFVFTRGEAWVYQQVEKVRPDLFARIRKLVERNGTSPAASSSNPTSTCRPKWASAGRSYTGSATSTIGSG